MIHLSDFTMPVLSDCSRTFGSCKKILRKGPRLCYSLAECVRRRNFTMPGLGTLVNVLAIVFGGLNLLFNRKIRVANLLPALVVAAFWR